MFSIKPKKVSNNDYLNISNDNNENNSVLSIDLKTINFENISVELALNVLQLKHNDYYNMNQTEIIQYYNNKMKLTNNINNILALKIILKYKLKGLDIKINKMNGIMLSEPELEPKLKQKNNLSKNYSTEQKINSIINNSQDDYKIQQIQQNNYKIIQKNTEHNINKNNIVLTKNLHDANVNIVQYPTVNLGNKNNGDKNNYNKTNDKIFTQSNQFTQSKQNLSVNEKINNMVVITSTEFDIDTIINSYVQKKNSGLAK